MADSNNFPHLKWSHSGSFIPKFGRDPSVSDQAKVAKADPVAHTTAISGQLSSLRDQTAYMQKYREEHGLPEIQGKSFVLKVADGANVDSLAHTLGIELVAETSGGYMFAASDSLDLQKFEEVLAQFSTGLTGGGAAAEIVEVFDDRDDSRKLDELLKGRVRDLWPFDDDQIFTFDLGLQSAPSTKSVEWTRAPRKAKDQSEEDHKATIEKLRNEDRIRADEKWDEQAENRYSELQNFVQHYDAELLSGIANNPHLESSVGIIFPDSIQVRVRMTGQGFRDLVENFPHLFEVSLPPQVEVPFPSTQGNDDEPTLEIDQPSDSAGQVCIIDSGIQEDHKWLEPALDSERSRSFLPSSSPDDIADYVSPSGHGTRVAGAALYPDEIPTEGSFYAPFWIQNARVLDAQNELPTDLTPENYLTAAVLHFQNATGTKIFNHSINARQPAEGKRMAAWPAKMDQLSHERDVLFIQSAGNVDPVSAVGDLGENYTHPHQLLSEHCQIADPAQSMHALTVGSITRATFDDADKQSFSTEADHPSSFSRAGFSPLWNVIKPEVVDYGGDYLHSKPFDDIAQISSNCAEPLISSTLYGGPAFSTDGVGTSFAAPKVAHIAALLNEQFPEASPQLYRALIIQSAQWPAWAEQEEDKTLVLRTIGYGVPSLERASTNDSYRSTLLTANAIEIRNKQYHLYEIDIPSAIRAASLENKIRISVTLAYTASPRRTRTSRNGYLETWLEWRSICANESLDEFQNRMQKGGSGATGFKWQIHHQTQHGASNETRRDLGSAQKDWCDLEANELPETFALAIRAHNGWNTKDNSGIARYALVVTFESLEKDLPIYNELQNVVETQVSAENQVDLF